VTVLEEKGNCIVCLEMRADELMRRLISGKLTNYRVVRTTPEPLHICRQQQLKAKLAKLDETDRAVQDYFHKDIRFM
jgi:hypothetical protein